MVHAQSLLRCEVDMLENGRVKDFIKRMLNTEREYVIFCSYVYLSDLL